MVKAILLKPLDGAEAGTEREFEADDFNRLKEMGAVRAVSDRSEKSAPTVANKAAPAVANKSTTTRSRDRF